MSSLLKRVNGRCGLWTAVLAAGLLLVVVCAAQGVAAATVASPPSVCLDGQYTPEQKLDCAALETLYATTNGDSWKVNTGWLDNSFTPPSYCSWYGVACNGEGRVHELRLPGNQLNGSINPKLSTLHQLVMLDLVGNQLSGLIPPELGNLGLLQHLHLSYNDLSGSIPAELGNLSELRWLLLAGNNLDGTIPPELAKLSSLDLLYLLDNELTGPIPRELGNLGVLRSLYVSGNQLSGSIPPELGNLRNLRWLFLDDNQLSGAIPAELANLFRLEEMRLQQNRLACWKSRHLLEWATDLRDNSPTTAWDYPYPGDVVCSSNLELIGQLGGNFRSVAVQGDYAYLTDGGLHVINVANPAHPTEVSFLDTSGPGRVAVAGEFAYVADVDGGLRIINIANPAAPAQAGFLDLPSSASAVAVAGNFAYVVGEGLSVINVASPSAPFEAGFIDTPGFASAVAVAGDNAYLSYGSYQWQGGLAVVNIASPAAMTVVGNIELGDCTDVAVVGPYAYVTEYYGGLRVFNVADPAAPIEIGAEPTAGDGSVAISAGYAFTAGYYGGLRVFNLTIPAAPVEEGSFDTPGSLGADVAVAGHTAYVAAGDAGLLILQFNPGPCPAVPGNLLQNYCFEDGPGPWIFWTDGAGTYLTSSADPYQGRFAADVAIAQAGSNVQFYQKEIALKPNTQYELSFAAYSSNGNNLSVYLQKHDAPYTNYGLNNFVVDLTTGWKVYDTTFTTKGFPAPVDDGRLRFWLAPYDASNMTYHIDWAVLREVDEANPPIPPYPPVVVPPPGQCSPPIAGNLIANPGFEDGKIAWTFYTDGAGSFTTVSDDPYECASNAKVSISTQGSNVQLYQKEIAVQGGKTYLLRLAARSSGGQDVSLFLHKHGAPYTNYGLNGVQLDLTPAWQVFVVEFTAVGNVPLTDARLRLWLGPFDQNGASFEFDDVVLLPKSAVAALDGPQITEGALAARQIRSQGQPANSVLVQGYFLDGDGAAVWPAATCRTTGRAGATRHGRPCHALPANGKMARVPSTALGSPRWPSPASSRTNRSARSRTGMAWARPCAQLRRERDDRHGAGLQHRLHGTYRGSSCSHEVVVTVPVDRHGSAVDSGAQFNSTVATE